MHAVKADISGMRQKYRRFVRILAYLAPIAIFLNPLQQSVAQVSSFAQVRISATLHGRIGVSARSFPVSIPLDSGNPASNHASFPLELNWNLNPMEVRGFEVIGYFATPESALVNAVTDTAVPAAYIQGRWESDRFQRFNEIHQVGSPGASLRLYSQSISPGRSRGARSGLLELQIDPGLSAELPDGSYRGVLYIEVRHY